MRPLKMASQMLGMAQTGRGLENSEATKAVARWNRAHPNPSVQNSTRPLQLAPGHPFCMAKWSRRYSDVDTGPWHDRRRLAWPKRAVALRIPRPTRPWHGGIEHSPIRPCQCLRGRSRWPRGITFAWPRGRVDIRMAIRGSGKADNVWDGADWQWA